MSKHEECKPAEKVGNHGVWHQN